MKENKSAEGSTAGVSPPTGRPPTFTIERLRRDCLALFGLTSSTYDGAVYGLSGQFTVEEMRKRLEQWNSVKISIPDQKKQEVD